MNAERHVFYFGCMHGPGHYMHRNPRSQGDDERRKVGHFLYSNPWGTKVDGGLCRPGAQVQGQVALHHKDGWTAVAFWDRSVDHREGSNSVFIVWGAQTTDQVLEKARVAFPEVFARFRFPITTQLNGNQLASIQGATT